MVPWPARLPLIRDLCIPAALCLVSAAAFLPVLDNGFVNWGDKADLLDNPHYRGFSPGHLAWMFSTIQMGHYQPLAWMTFALDYAIWGLDPRGFHLTSLLFHAATAAAVYFLLRQLLRIARTGPGGPEPPGAALAAAAGALLFAVHPLRVEPIAWATERRGCLSGLLLVLSCSAYVRYAELRSPTSGESDPGAGKMKFAALLLFVLALLAKEIAVTLPAVLIILDFYPLRRLNWSRGLLGPSARPVWREKLPFVLIAAVGCAVAILSSRQSGGARTLAEHTIAQRLAQSGFGLMFYLEKTLVPLDLSPLYRIPVQLDPRTPRFIAGGIGVIAITALLILFRRRFPAGLAAWACYVILLLPVLGLAQTGPQIAADRYTYLPSIAISALAAAGILRFINNPAENAIRPVRIAVAVLLCVGLAIPMASASRRQLAVWKTSESLWRHVLRLDPESPWAHTNLGVVRMEQRELSDAMAHFRSAIAADPRSADAYSNLGVALAEQGRMSEAMDAWNDALRLDPRHAAARRNLDRARSLRGDAPGLRP